MEEQQAREEAPLYSEDDSMTPNKAYDELVACLAGETVSLKEVLSNGHAHYRVGTRAELGYNHRDELGCATIKLS